MVDREKVIKGLNCCCYMDGSICAKCPYGDAGSYCTALMSMDALELLKEQENTLGVHQTMDGIAFTSTGTAQQGEERGILLGKEVVYERLYNELFRKNLMTDEIRQVFEQVRHICIRW